MSVQKKRMLLSLVLYAVLACAAWILLGDCVSAFQARRHQERLRSLYHGHDALSFFVPRAAAEEFLTEAVPYFQESSLEEEKSRPQSSPIPPVFEALEEGPTPPPIQNDFQALYEVNPDVIGWLTAGEVIDYPVVQRDNEAYLSINFYGKKDANGALFLHEAGKIWPRSTVLQIYGHAMRGRAMFGTLRQYKDEVYLRQNPMVTLRTIYDETPQFYVPFAGFDASMLFNDRWYFDLARINFGSPEAYRAYLEEVQSRSYWHTSIEVGTEDELLVLITCSYIQNNGRFLLFCRKLREGEEPEAVYSIVSGDPWSLPNPGEDITTP